MQNLMSISFASEQSNKENGNKFIALQGTVVVDGRLLDAELLLDGASPGVEVFQRIAAKYREAFDAGLPEAYPRGFAVEAPGGFLVDWDQNREPYEDKKGVTHPGRWVIKPLRVAEGPSVRLTKMPPVSAETTPEAEELLAQYGI